MLKLFVKIHGSRVSLSKLARSKVGYPFSLRCLKQLSSFKRLVQAEVFLLLCLSIQWNLKAPCYHRLRKLLFLWSDEDIDDTGIR